jgi:membrane-associated phospholipid phosphatase
MKKVAHFISTIGSPVVLLPLFSIYTAITQLGSTAAMLCILTTLSFAICFAIYMFGQVRAGRISNLDASVRSERQHQVYVPLIIAFSTVLLGFYWCGQARIVLVSTACLLLLFVFGFIVNYRIKASLHTAMPLYLGITALATNAPLGIALILLSVPIAWSRIVLGRHTLIEVFAGGILATFTGGIFMLLS